MSFQKQREKTMITFNEESVSLGFKTPVSVSVSLISHDRFFSSSANRQPNTPVPVIRGRAQEAVGVEDVPSPGMQWMQLYTM